MPRRSATSSSTPDPPCCWWIPELDGPLQHLPAKHRFALGAASDAELFLRRGTTPRFGTADENATVSINYTSGTTARPKGVQLTHRSFWLNAVTFGWHVGVTDRDVYLHTLPTFHCNGWGMPYALTAMGARQVIIRKIDGEEILRRVEREGVTLFNCAPAVIAAVLEAAALRRQRGAAVPGRGRVRVVVAGAPPPSRTIERVETELGWEFIQIYGLTETAPLLTINRAPAEWDGLASAERARRLSRAGVPAVGVRMRVDAEGEVLARSNHVFEGYWNQPAETAKALADGWFHTGDGGQADGPYLAITDRKKDVIITGGENVSSIEVEDCLYLHPAVAEAAVIGVPDEKWGETVKALVVLRPGGTATEAELIEHCRGRLAHYKCPRSVEIRPALSRTATGKLQKFRLREPYWTGRDRRVNYRRGRSCAKHDPSGCRRGALGRLNRSRREWRATARPRVGATPAAPRCTQGRAAGPGRPAPPRPASRTLRLGRRQAPGAGSS